MPSVHDGIEFRITGITPFGLLGDASGVRGLLADLRGEILAVHADSVAPANTLTPAADAASDGTSFRDRRRSRLAEGHRRHEILSAAAPSGDPQFINAIAAADRFWGPDEQWREALHYQHVEPADADITVGTPQVAAAKSRTTKPVAVKRVSVRRRVNRACSTADITSAVVLDIDTRHPKMRLE